MIPYDLSTDFVEEYRRILILSRSQYDTIIDFLQNEKMWRKQAERDKNPRGGYEKTIQMNTTHYQTGQDCALLIRSELATISIFGTQKPAPWVECEGPVYADGWARIKKIPEIEDIPHIFLSLLDNNYLSGMHRGRVVLICEDPEAPTLVDLGLCKSNREIEEERKEEEKKERKEEKPLSEIINDIVNVFRKAAGMRPLEPGEEDNTDYGRQDRHEKACIRAAQRLERGKR